MYHLKTPGPIQNLWAIVDRPPSGTFRFTMAQGIQTSRKLDPRGLDALGHREPKSVHVCVSVCVCDVLCCVCMCDFVCVSVAIGISGYWHTITANRLVRWG